MTICLAVGAVCPDDKTVHFLLFLWLLWFLVITWCWINTFIRCYHCGLQSPFFGFLRAWPSGWLREPALHKLAVSKMLKSKHLKSTQFTAELNSQWCHLDFPICTKTTVTLLFICLLYWFQHTLCFSFYYDSICTRIFFSFFFSERMKLADDKRHLLANAQEHKCTSATGIWVKKVYRTWLLCCKFLSSICP